MLLVHPQKLEGIIKRSGIYESETVKYLRLIKREL